jgi:hypothetical protein
MLTLGDRMGAIPLLILPAGAYAAFAEGFADARARLAEPLFVLPTATGASWAISLSDLLIAASLIVFFLELFKAMATRRVALVNHALAMVLFVACLAAMLVLPPFATSTFFLLTLMVLLDVVAGFVATVARDDDR